MRNVVKKTKTKDFFKRLLTFGVYVCVALFIFLTLRDNFEQVKHFKIEQPAYIFVGLVAYGAQFVLNAYIWALLMKFVNEKVSTVDSMEVYVSSFVVRYIPGNIWAIAARAAMNKKYGVPSASSVWGWVIENITYLIVGMIFSVFVLLRIRDFPNEITWVVVIAFPACVIFLLKYELIERFVRFLAKKKFPEIAQKEFEKFDLSEVDRFKLLGLYGLSWILYSIQFVFIAQAVGVGDVSTAFILAGINALAWTIGYISIITPSGTGVREAIIVFSLSTLGLATEIESIAIALIARISSIVAEIVCFGAVKLFHACYAEKSKRG